MPSSWLRRVTERSRSSWTRWRLSRRQARAERLRRRWETRLRPVVLPMHQAMVRLSQEQEKIRLLLEQLALLPTAESPEMEEIRSLLLEVLNSLQPEPTAELALSL